MDLLLERMDFCAFETSGKLTSSHQRVFESISTLRLHIFRYLMYTRQSIYACEVYNDTLHRRAFEHKPVCHGPGMPERSRKTGTFDFIARDLGVKRP